MGRVLHTPIFNFQVGDFSKVAEVACQDGVVVNESDRSDAKIQSSNADIVFLRVQIEEQQQDQNLESAWR